MGLILNRRREMGGEVGERLLFWWTGQDALVNNQWIDRVRGSAWTKQGTVTRTSDNGYSISDGDNNNFVKDNSNELPIYLGYHYKIEMTFKHNVTNNSVWLIDLGSVASTNSNTGLLCLPQYYDNYKFFGNNTGTTYGVGGNSNLPTFAANTKYTIVYGCKEWTNGNDIQYLECNGQTYYAPNPHTPINIQADTFQRKTFYIGRGLYAGYGIVGSAVLYELKIYSEP